MSYLNGWLYSKQIVLTGHASGAQTNYQIKIDVNHVAGMQYNFNDLRFTKSDGSTLLNAWLENKVDGISATVWVETDTPANGVDADIYMHYGNAGVASNWDGDATFITYTGLNTTNYVSSLDVSGSGYAYRASWQFDQENAQVLSGFGDSATRFPTNSILLGTYIDNWYIQKVYKAGAEKLGVTGALTWTIDTPYIHEIRWDSSGVSFYKDGVQWGTTYTGDTPTANVGIFNYYHVGSGQVNWQFIRKYVTNPATYSINVITIDRLHNTRIKDRFTTPYYTEEGGNIDKLVQVVTQHIIELSSTSDDIVAAHQLSEARGHSLDQWGNMLQVIRDTSETDAHYRARLLSYSVLYRRSATPQQMVSSCADVLGVETSRISLSDSSSPATFTMAAFLSDIEAAGLSLLEYVAIMNVAKAGGVSLSLLSAGSFECKAIAGGHDSTKGYNNIADANPDGGLYAGLIGVI